MKTAPIRYQRTSWLPRSSFWPCGNGGTIGVLTGSDGAFMVDSQFAPLTEKIVAAIMQVQPDSRVRLMVNTHVHGDHTGGVGVRDKVATLVKQGKTVQEVLAAKATADFDAKVTGVGNTIERFVNQFVRGNQGREIVKIVALYVASAFRRTLPVRLKPDTTSAKAGHYIH